MSRRKLDTKTQKIIFATPSDNNCTYYVLFVTTTTTQRENIQKTETAAAT